MERPPIRVLHVEDNEFFALVASNVLAEEHPDVSVTSVSTADEALSRLETEPSDCVVSTLQGGASDLKERPKGASRSERKPTKDDTTARR